MLFPANLRLNLFTGACDLLARYYFCRIRLFFTFPVYRFLTMLGF